MAKRSTTTSKRSKASGKTTTLPLHDTETYTHPEASALLRPDVGTVAQFKKKKPPATYRYDSSLAPELTWDGQNAARELGEWLLKTIEEAAKLSPPHTFQQPREFRGQSASSNQSGPVIASVRGLEDAVGQLKRLSGAFLNWAGKAERLSFDVPTLPLFIHERLSTKAILETLKGHKRDKQLSMFDLFGDRQHPIHEQVLRAYEHRNGWVNRMVLGDSLVVMNSLLHYEGLGGQVQMIYMDPPYGVKFGSNFQPFVRKRDVVNNNDEHMTREPEMVKAYRDTWELGLHSYLTYMRDRLLLCRDLLGPQGSVFVQISDENLHHLRELMDEIFGADNVVGIVVVQKTASATSELIGTTADFILWYAKDKGRCKYRRMFTDKLQSAAIDRYDQVELPDGSRRPMTPQEKIDPDALPRGAKRFQLSATTSSRPPGDFPVEFEGKAYQPRTGYWKTGKEGMAAVIAAKRIVATSGGILRYVRYAQDFPYEEIDTLWTDISGGVQSRSDPKVYVVQTSTSVVQRCMLMTTDPGDLLLDPTCGSGTTAYVAEHWGRRWITIDTSRVPLALTRQRLLTATFPYYELNDESRGPAGGFAYKRKQNNKGEDIGGIVPHITLKSIANNEPPDEEVLVDRPEQDNKTTRVTGPFCFEATIPTPVDWEGDGEEDSGIPAVAESHGSFIDRMLEVLRKSPVLQLGGGKSITLKNVRRPAKTLSLSAEAMVEGHAPGTPISLDGALQVAAEQSGKALPFTQTPVAIVFGPENGAISQKTVFESAMEARAKGYAHLYVIGFAIQPTAREAIEKAEAAYGIAATYVQATPDLLMGDLLKNMRSSQIFSVCGLPEIKLHKASNETVAKITGDPPDAITGDWRQVELLGLDMFDPATMETDHRAGADVPAWLLDTDYNGMVFHVTQAFFPRTAAWDSLKRELKGEYDDAVWEHLAGTVSAPFQPGEHGQIAVKVIDDRGNELMVVKHLNEPKT